MVHFSSAQWAHGKISPRKSINEIALTMSVMHDEPGETLHGSSLSQIVTAAGGFRQHHALEAIPGHCTC
jgi:hypothetical protein